MRWLVLTRTNCYNIFIFFKMSSVFSRNDGRFSIFIHCHISDLGLRDNDLRFRVIVAVGVDIDFDGDRSPPDPDRFGVERNLIADEHRIMKDDFIHGDRDVIHGRCLSRFERAGNVEIGQDDTAENSAISIGIFGQRHNAEHRIFFQH